MGLKQKLRPNKAQASFISSKHVTVKGQPIEESIRHSRSKCFQSFSKGVQRFVCPPASQTSCHLMPKNKSIGAKNQDKMSK
jgi:hypothetical protein